MNKKKKSFAGMQNFIFMNFRLCQFRWYSAVLPYLACVTQISMLLITMLLPKLVLDAVEQKNNVVNMWNQILGVGIILAFTTVLNMVLHNVISSISQQLLYSELTKLWEKKMIQMDYQTFLSAKGKVIMEKARQVISSPNWGCVSFLQRLTELIEAMVGLVVYCIIIGNLHPILLLLLVILFVVEMGWGYYAEKKKHQQKDEKAKVDRKLNYLAYGMRGLKEAKDIRIYSMRGILREINKGIIAEKETVETKIQKWELSHMMITALLIFIRDGFCYFYLITRFLEGEMSIGNFTVYFAVITGVGEWLTKLAYSISAYTEVSNYITDFRDFLELGATVKKQNKVLQHFEQPIEFRFENVSFSYKIASEEGTRNISVIKNLNLVIHGGEKLALVGVNGAGKSTFIKILCGMQKPDKGRVLINGNDIQNIMPENYFSLFAAVFQKSQLLPVSIEDNIIQGGEEDSKRMWDCIRLAGLEEKIKSLPKQEKTTVVKQISEEGVDLSGGQQQRLFLARALYKNAPVLILDEPTAALDPIAENDIYQKYNELTKGKTSVFVSHRLSSTRFCDRILFMEQGEIVEIGSHEELMGIGGKYADMYAVQSEYYKNTVQTQEKNKDGGIA